MEIIQVTHKSEDETAFKVSAVLGGYPVNSVSVNKKKYLPEEGNIALPDYPTTPQQVGALPANTLLTKNIKLNNQIFRQDAETIELPDLSTPEQLSNEINRHNNNDEAHEDIRNLLAGMQLLLQSDDAMLDELQEIVSYIKSNRELIDSVTVNKVNVADIVDHLTSNSSDKPLSANMGMVLRGLIDTCQPKGDYATKTDLQNLNATTLLNKNQIIPTTIADIQTTATNFVIDNYGRNPKDGDGLILTVTDWEPANDKQYYLYSSASGYWVSAGSASISIVLATATAAGILKLYKALGNNTDGTVTQKAINDALALKSNIADIVDNLTSTGTSKPLSANMGRYLKSLIDGITVSGIGGATAAQGAKADTALQSIPYATATTSLTSGGTGVIGTSTNVSRQDHTHTLPAYPTLTSLGAANSTLSNVSNTNFLAKATAAGAVGLTDTDKYNIRVLWDGLKGHNIQVDASGLGPIERLYKTSGNILMATYQTVRNADGTITETMTANGTTTTKTISVSGKIVTTNIV